MKLASFLVWRGRDARYWLAVMAIICGLLNLGVAIAVDVPPLETRLRAVNAAGGSSALVLYAIADSMIPSNWTMGACLIFMGAGSLWLGRPKREGSMKSHLDLKKDEDGKGE